MEKPKPFLGPDNASFWEGCRKKQLTFQKCSNCAYVRWPPSIVCPRCHSLDHEELVSSGRGQIYSYVVYHFPYHPAFQEELPYVVALVEMEEGPRIISNIVDCDPAELDCELSVELIWEERGEFTLPKFRPRKA